MKSYLQDLIARHLWDPPWRSIKALGSLPILGVSITTLLSVPLLARAIATSREHIESFMLLTSNRQASEWLQTVADSLQLPLTIRLLVLSAFFAVLGKGIYGFSCPPYFRIGESYEEFRRKYSFASETLSNEFLELWNFSPEPIRWEISEDIKYNYGRPVAIHGRSSEPTLFKEIGPETTIRIEEQTGPEILRYDQAVKRSRFGGALWDILVTRRDHSKPWPRRVCAWVFYVAIVFAGLALLAQIQWVFKAMI